MREPRVDTQTKNVRKNGKAHQIFLEHTSKDWSLTSKDWPLTSKDWPLNLQDLAAQRTTKWVHWWTFCYTNSSYLSWRPQDSGQKCPSKSMALNGRCIFWCVRVAVVDSMAVGILPFCLLQNQNHSNNDNTTSHSTLLHLHTIHHTSHDCQQTNTATLPSGTNFLFIEGITMSLLSPPLQEHACYGAT